MADPKIEAARPLSPHLFIYRPMLTMMLSVVHRGTGMVLYFGTILLAWWLIAAGTNEAYFTFVDNLAGSWIGRLILFGYTWALIHHACGGVRHFFWDTGYGFSPEVREWAARFTVVASVTLTIAVWIIGYVVR